MEQLGMKALDTSFRSSDSKAAGKAGKTSDEFLTMLQTKQADSQSDKEVSKDTKTEKDSVSDDTKKEPVSEDKEKGKAETSEKAEKTEKTEEDTSQTEGMLAAYHASQSLRPEIIQITPETEAVPAEDMIAVSTDAAAEAAAAEVIAPQISESGTMQPIRQAAVTDRADVRADTAEAAVTQEVNAGVVTQAQSSETKQEPSDLTSGHKEEDKTVQPEEVSGTASENLMAGQMTAAAEARQTVQTEKPVQEYVSVVHAEQPEELPEKVTDQLLAKLTEGVQEFEIHIEPANLGKIAIKILYEGNQANISIVCSEKRAWEALGQNAREIGNIIERNLGGETTIVVEKQETDYLNQTRDENEQAGQNGQQKEKEQNKDQNADDSEQFLQKLRLGLAG